MADSNNNNDKNNLFFSRYRIPADKKILEITGSRVCVGTNCAVVSTGELHVGDDIFAVVEEKPKMKVKET